MTHQHYEINERQLCQIIRKADKYSTMIDPKDVVEGQEHLCSVLCKACDKIPLNLCVYKCRHCKSAICRKCFLASLLETKDKKFDIEQQFKR